MNDIELRCYKWLMNKFNNLVDYQEGSHLFTADGNSFICKSLQTDRITFSSLEIPRLIDKKVTVLVFSIGNEPVAQIPIKEIDFEKRRWHNIRVYTALREVSRSIYLTANQYEELERTKELLEDDFGKRYSFGDIVHMLCMSYMIGRNVIMRESQPVLVNEPIQPSATEEHD